LFTELRVGDRVVASTSNFVSGGAGFAFKVGWESELRKYSPGMLNEVELVRAAPEVCADLAWFDSGAAPDSFINRLWPRRRELATLVVPLTRLAGSSVRWSVRLRAIARRVRPATSAADGGTTGNAAEEP
jgi:CelD/BcsL family acetyltransferase involved in cellulose biosynthesis